MKIFLDTADVSEIKQAVATGLVDGVTTNPALVARSGRPFTSVLRDIAKLVKGPISAEVTALDSAGMIKQAAPLLKIHKNIVIKVPMTEAGIAACVALRKKGNAVNVTLVFTVNQALLAAKAGATFVSPFVGRIDDSGEDGLQLVNEIVQVYDNYQFPTQILAASIRHSSHVHLAALAGADVATMPPAVFHELFQHHLTDVGLQQFLQSWKKVQQR